MTTYPDALWQARRQLDEQVARAIAQYADWHRAALPSAEKIEPRVSVVHRRGDEQGVLRRPFKHRGKWCVRWHGTARLTQSFQRENGDIVFVADWS